MVEYSINLDTVFYSLADATRRDILKRVSREKLSISNLAKPYKMSFAAIAKHVHVLETAHLITKEKVGKEQIVSASPQAITAAAAHLQNYEELWNSRFEMLEELLLESK